MEKNLSISFPLKLRLSLATLLAVAFAFPNLAELWYHADPLTIANESVAYRYLFSERLLNGEGSSVWVLAGFLTTAMQTTWLAVLNLFSHANAAELHWRLQAFSYGFSAMVILGATGVLFAAAINRRLSSIDLALLALPALGPAYATRSSGFYYYTLPDYYHLNVLLTLVSVWLFLLMWRRDQPVTHPLRRLVVVGLFVGVMCANKITMLMIGLPIIAVCLFDSPLGWRQLLARGLVCGASIATGFLAIIAWFYLFKLKAVIGMFGVWLNIIRNPGGEANFWSAGYLTGYSYGYIIGFFLLVASFAVAISFRIKSEKPKRLLVAATFLLGGVAWAYFVFKRPAGTTFFEAAVALFGFSAMALGFCQGIRWVPRMIVLMLLGWTGYSASTFQWRSNLATLRESGPWARNMWKLHHELLAFAQGRDIIVVHPRNEYGYGGVAEFLLKGTADVPSWNVSSHGRPILERYAPHMSFRHEYSGISPNAPYPGNSVVFWVDRPEFPPLVDRYSQLRAISDKPGVVSKEWTMVIQGGRATIHAHAIALPPEDLPLTQKVVESPPSDFSGTRIKPNEIELKWHPDGISSVAFQFKAGNGEWFALGRANENMRTYHIGDISPSATYTIRARKEYEDRHSAWVEAVVPPFAPPIVAPSEGRP